MIWSWPRLIKDALLGHDIPEEEYHGCAGCGKLVHNTDWAKEEREKMMQTNFAPVKLEKTVYICPNCGVASELATYEGLRLDRITERADVDAGERLYRPD